MPKSVLTIGLYLGVFLLSLGGFLGAKYLEQGSVVADSSTKVTLSSRTVNQAATKLVAGDYSSHHNGADTVSTAPDRIANQVTSGTYKTAASADSVQRRPATGGSKSYQQDAATASTSTFNAPVGFASASVQTSAASGGGNSTNSSISGNKSSSSAGTDIPAVSDNPLPETTDSAASDDDDSTAPPVDLGQEIPDDQLLATPNCPVQLVEGSTETDARLMRENYGCRYMQTCRNMNDGTGNVKCWWSFYSAS